MGCGFFDYLNKNYSYYNAPEGQDPVGKLVGLGKYGFISGTMISLYDACLWSHCVNAAQFFNTFGYWVAPMTGMCLAFSTVTYSLCRFRNKDDKLNYIGGALASGSVVHCWKKSPRLSGWVTIGMVLYAVLKKQAILDGHDRNILMSELDEETQHKSYFPWRTLPYRNYSSKPRFPHNKEDYYINHY
ncbi:uncharacterized protein LOC131673660 [Phymastichus coffea]|uniref:uncharacterized protein LOC131673660 n=1 Tax=Phymastichus coffea TaxID=108790 RepID=UPI00273AB56F|nr:uncharacterized protein LOC131673660 [Phymastichus coffea]XP_058807815.1 uncharacterized protein LOC131673660 [Phymastichus coffea]XP_058807816.1 uncharacterized protein LOC131673660 [Phymastichus coffea]XP_058807817.1 uncharacterized protein LOC131673660 [Phymastichus coffea]